MIYSIQVLNLSYSKHRIQQKTLSLRYLTQNFLIILEFRFSCIFLYLYQSKTSIFIYQLSKKFFHSQDGRLSHDKILVMDSETVSELTNAFRQIKNICEKVLYRLQAINSQSFRHDKNYTDHIPATVPKRQPVTKFQNLFSSVAAMQQTQALAKSQISKKGARSRKPKKPKAPMTPYFIFFNTKRQLIHSKYPHLSQAEMANVAGQVWRSLQPQEKQQYERQYQANKARYAIEIKKFYEMYPDEIPVKQKRKMGVQEGDNSQFEHGEPKDFENEEFNDETFNDIKSEASIQ